MADYNEKPIYSMSFILEHKQPYVYDHIENLGSSEILKTMKIIFGILNISFSRFCIIYLSLFKCKQACDIGYVVY